MSSLDPITTEILRNAFVTAAMEMNAALVRSSYTPVIYESKDSAVALVDSQHRVLGHSSGIPLFLGNLEACTLQTEEMFGREIWADGDIWIMNDSYMTGTHMHDVTVFAPLFYEDRLAGFGASRAHWLDIGAKDPGVPMNATEIYQEGLRMAPTRIVRGGEPVEEFIELIRRNVRFPVSAIGDLHAQFSVAEIGKRRLGALLDRYGRETVEAAAEEIFLQTERMDNEVVATIPDGLYEAQGYLDDDGAGGEPILIAVKIEVAGERMTIDLTDVEGPARGPINCGAVQALSACRLAFKFLINPQHPVNGGTFRSLDVKVKPGSVLGAQEPSPCQFYFTPLGLLIDLILKALAPAFPETAAAGHYGDAMVIQFNGTNPQTGKKWLENEPHAGGWGGSDGRDGQDGLIWSCSGAFKDTPIEIFESKFPARITEYGLRKDSCGPGQWRGGCGIIREYLMDTDDVEMSLWFDRSVTPSWGISGGGDAEPPAVIINPEGTKEHPNLKTSRRPLARGDVVRCLIGGGGGFGDPLLRDHNLVAADIQDGFISEEFAQRHHGYRSDH